MKPESTGEGGAFICGWGIIGIGGGTVLGHRRKVQKCEFPGRTAPLENHPKTPLGWLKWQVLHMKPESTGEGGVFICGWGITAV